MINTEISEAIEAAMRETTFTEAALETFKDSLDKVKRLEKQLSNAQDTVFSTTNSYEEAILQNGKLTDDVEKLNDQLDDFKKREDKLTANETARAVAEGKYNAFVHGMELVFKVPSVRREVTSSQGQPQYTDSSGFNQYPSDIVSSETVVETEE